MLLDSVDRRQCAGELLTASAVPVGEGRALLAHVLGCTREQLLAHPERRINAPEARRFRQLIERRVAGEPLAYLLGQKEFYGHAIEVSPAVLIPRPETELLVDTALRLVTERYSNVLDLGTGSGCIALALGLERPEWRIIATDSSAAAIAVARTNAAKLRARNVKFRLGDWFAAVAPDAHFELIVSNPPYVAEADPHLSELRFEPTSALIAQDRGLACLRRIIEGAASFLVPGGSLALEHGFDQGPAVRGVLAENRWDQIHTSVDPAGLERVTCAQKAPVGGAKLPKTIGSDT